MLKHIFSVILGVVFVGGVDLPGYIKKCKLSDPNLGKCITERANEAIPRITKGDPDFKLINMSPMVVPEMKLGANANLEMKLTQVTSDNLKDVKIISSNFDKESNKMSYVGTIPVLETLCKYSMNGRIVLLPIRGEGNANITFISPKINYEVEFRVRNAGDEKFYVLDKSDLKIEPERVYFHFENLFGGDPHLSKQMADFLDENWKEFFQELRPVIEQTMRAITDNVYIAYFSKVPLSNIFDD